MTAELGSILDFAEQDRKDARDPSTLASYTIALHENRLALAAGLGVTLNELHELRPMAPTGLGPEDEPRVPQADQTPQL